MRIRYWRSDVCSPELDRRFHLVPVAEAVEQAELHGLLPAVGRAVDEVAHRAGFQVARFGHGGDDLRERRIEVALQVLALRLGQRVFGQEGSEERRVGKGWVSTCRSRWSPDH